MTFDFLIFNGNSRKFVQAGYAFSFNFAGLSERKIIMNHLTLDLYNFRMDGVAMRTVAEIGCLLLLVFFFTKELEKMQEQGMKAYWTVNMQNYIELVSIFLCVMVFVFRAYMM